MSSKDYVLCATTIPCGLFECEVIEEREVLQEAELSGQADPEKR
jgi:hypothetical protein